MNMKKSGAVAVIGAGITGMQASLDLADSGYKVYLIERTSSIGGRMVQLDKTFPTGDCAMCTISPRMVGVTRHPDIHLLMYTEVTNIEGKAGDFTVTVKKKPRYIIEDKCTGCGLCATVCPINLPNEFVGGLGSKKAAYIPFPQAAPLIYTIDREHCIRCGLCSIICESGAIDHDQEEEEIKLKVGAIVTSTGYDQFDPSAMGEYGYKVFKNVILNLQFERMLSAAGPTAGHVIRPSDGKPPKTIGFIQCVGSRDIKNYPYCSRICCMASTKEAIVACEHNTELKPTIFYMDMRAYGKGYQEYVNKAKDEHGIKYVRGRVAEIQENPDNNNLIIRHENTEEGRVDETEVDMVILAAALKPATGSKELAKMLGIRMDEYGFYQDIKQETPSVTTKEGVYICGAAQGPVDIPDAMAQASSASAGAEAMLKDVRRTEIEVKEEVPEKEITEEPRIGVFICHCGLNIASVVDVKGVAEYALEQPNVEYATNTIYACSGTNLQEIKKVIKEHDLNRIIVASCTPRMHEPTFRATIQEAGLNPYLFEMANIREHCSWVHSKEPEKATEKAKDLVRMALARTRLLSPQQKGRMKLGKNASIIGGGVAGMTAAIEIAKQGFTVDLVEQEKELGGSLLTMNSVFINAADPEKILEPLKKAVEKDKKITVHTASSVKALAGYTGNFELEIEEDGKAKTIQTGAVIVATGSSEKKPEEGTYLYGKNLGVITQMELEEKLKKDDLKAGTVVMIQCVGARDKDIPGCSRTCCVDAVKNAKILKKKNPDSRVFILYRDMMMFGKFEDEYRNSQEDQGVEYLRYTVEKPPEVKEKEGKLVVTVYDSLLKREIEIGAETVVLSTPQVPSEGTEELQKILRVPLSPQRFFMEGHVKLRPFEFISDGLFLCGSCQSPKELSLAIAQAAGAASKVCSLLSHEIMETEATTSVVNEELCIACGRCIEICPFSAISFKENEKGEQKSWVNDALCKSCGLCASVCPNGAITPRHFSTPQIIAMIDALLEEA